MIVFTGGGNFGDLWPATHELRERVLRDFRGVRVVQLQQSVNFKRDATLARTRTLLERHGNVALLVRDLPSLELARHAFGVNVSLGPDLAFACPIVDVTRSAPTVDVLWIARQDRESRRLGPRRAPAGVWRIDWNLRDDELRPLDGETPLPRPTIELIDRNRSLTRALAPGRPDTASTWRELAGIRAQLTDRRPERACRLLARGRVIVTDSLHAHILGLMLEIPTVATDNNYGKLRGTFEAFTHAAPIARWAETPSEALTVAGELLKESSREASAAGRDPLARWRLPHSHPRA